MRTQNTVRTARPALRGSVALIFATGALLVCTSSRALNEFRPTLPVTAQDTVQLNALLVRVRGADPTICHLVGRALDNRWGFFGDLVIDPASAGADQQLIDWIHGASIEPSLVPPLRRGLNDGDACVRRTAAHLLGRSRIGDLSAELRAELASSAAPTREAALLALGYFDRPTGIEAAQRALRDGDANVRVAAAWALGMIESTDAIPALTAAARDSDARMRRTVAWALGTIESATSVPTLSAMLSDADVTVRIQAAFALGQIESADAIPALVRLLETDRDPRVRRAAAAALGQISG